MEWEEFWNTLLDERKLRLKVAEMDQVDDAKGHIIKTEEICHHIYDDYSLWKSKCEDIKKDIWDIIEKFKGVHLHTSRIKSVDSLIEKVIRKRYVWLGDDDSKYANISAENYKDIITDLVGLRLIINYRGHWLDIHNEILSEFPLDLSRTYEEDELLAHISGRNIQAELPKVYYAEGDDIRQYKENGLKTKKHSMNYRSIHYTLSYQGTYIEIQVRTIYDEAWSDCDHNYVYKKDDNRSHTALEQVSSILSKLTNLASDIGEQMKCIYDSQSVVDYGSGWKASEQIIDDMNKVVQRMEKIEEDIITFKDKLTVNEVARLSEDGDKND